MADAPQVGAITDVATAGLRSSGVVVENIVLSSSGGRRLLRVFVARDLSGLSSEDHTSTVEPLSLDEVAQATRTLNDVLDRRDDVMGEQPYTLEVSSVGVGAPLTRPEHFRRNVGRLVQIVDEAGLEHTSRLLAASPAGIQLQPGARRWLAYDQISRAIVHVEFNRATTGEQG